MKQKRPAAWTDRWLRQVPYRQMQKLIRYFDDPKVELSSLGISRKRRTKVEWQRRKREGRGGLAAREGAL